MDLQAGILTEFVESAARIRWVDLEGMRVFYPSIYRPDEDASYRQRNKDRLRVARKERLREQDRQLRCLRRSRMEAAR